MLYADSEYLIFMLAHAMVLTASVLLIGVSIVLFVLCVIWKRSYKIRKVSVR